MSDDFIKDPSEQLDYTWDWGPWLADVSDTIASATVTVPDGLTAVGAATIGETEVTQMVEGGTEGGAYRMVCQITTVGGRVGRRKIDLTIVDR